MYPVSDRFADVVTGSHRAISRARLLVARQIGVSPVGGIELPILGGDVKMASSSDVKWTLDLTVPGDYWDQVQSYSGEIFVERGVDFGDGTSEMIPLGYYGIDDPSQDNAPYGPVSISGSDRIATLQRNRQLVPYPVPDGTSHRTVFERLVNGRLLPTDPVGALGPAMLVDVAVPITWLGYDPDRVVVSGGQVVSDSAYDFLAKIADGQSCVLRFDESGSMVVDLRDRDPDTLALYVIEEGRTGTLVSASRKAPRDGVYNAVTAYGSDPAHPTAYVTAKITDPNSPIRYGGPFGNVVRYYASPLITTDAQAADAAASVLSRYTGLPETESIYTVPNPAIRPLDAVGTRLAGLPTVHLVDTVTIPLFGQDPAEIETRSMLSDVAPDTPPTPDPTPDPTTPTPTPDPGTGGSTPGAPVVYSSAADALNIGTHDGQVHCNLGLGWGPNNPFGAAPIHHNYTLDELEAGLSIPSHFYLDSTTGYVVFSVDLDGGRTTTNTRYPRCETRMENQDGSNEAFIPNSGTHYARRRFAVHHLPPNKPEVVPIQMHNASDDTIEIRMHDQTANLLVNGNQTAVLTTNLARDMFCDVELRIVDGDLFVFWSQVASATAPFDPNWAPAYTGLKAFNTSTPQYFKMGAYSQSWAYVPGDTSERRGSPPTAATDALSDGPCVIYNAPGCFEVWHTGTPKPSRVYASTGASTGTGGGSTTTPGGTTTPTTPVGDDGTQAAVLLGWGGVIDGDEFDYVGPPGSKWSMYDGPGHDHNGIRSPGAFAVSNGILTCTGDNVNGGTTGGMEFQRDQKYFRIEWRVRCYSINPSGKGNRYHPVLILWPTSDQWPQGGEYDFYEVDCDTGKFEQYQHIPGNDGSKQEYYSMPLDLQNWHNIAFEWSKTAVTTWVDGKQVSQYKGSYIQAPGPMHPTFQMDNFFGSGMEPAKFEAKWCRIYASPS